MQRDEEEKKFCLLQNHKIYIFSYMEQTNRNQKESTKISLNETKPLPTFYFIDIKYKITNDQFIKSTNKIHVKFSKSFLKKT